MKKTPVVRVGICNCTKSFHRRLEGRQLVVGKQRLVVNEVTVNDENVKASLLQLRPHFFLDVHNYPWRYGRLPKGKETILIRHDLVPIKTGGWRFLPVGAVDDWIRRRPPTVDEVLVAMTKLIQDIPAKRRGVWLQKMGTRCQPSKSPEG